MPCYMCKTTTGPFQRLEVARLRFIRKAQPLFKDDSYLCPKCFKQFETIYKSKSKSKSSINDTNSSRTTISNASSKTISSSNTNNSKNTSHGDKSFVTAVRRSADGNNISNSNDNPSPTDSVVHFDSRSIETPSSNDSTDKIVQLSTDFLSIRDSSRKTTSNPGVNVARQQAEGAVQIAASKRQRTLQEEEITSPPASREVVQTEDEGGNNSDDNAVIHFESRSQHSSSSNDTMDKIVQMQPNFISLMDSSRKTNRNPALNIARQEAEAAVQKNTSKRKRILLQPDTTPRATPPPPRRALDIVDEESSEDEDLAAAYSPNDLVHVRPVARRRKQPVVQQYGDVMDFYVGQGSGG